MDLKKQVVKQIAEGKTNQQIIDFMSTVTETSFSTIRLSR